MWCSTFAGGLCAEFSIVGGAAIFQERIPAATFTNSRCGRGDHMPGLESCSLLAAASSAS